MVSIGLSYFIGRLEKYDSKKNEAEKERYQSFYAEYLKLLITSSPFKDDYSKMSFEARAKFLDLIFQNFHLIDSATASYCSSYYYAFLDMLEYDDGNQQFSMAPKTYNEIFKKISKSVIKESTKLSKKLKLPDISQVVLDANDLD